LGVDRRQRQERGKQDRHTNQNSRHPRLVWTADNAKTRTYPSMYGHKDLADIPLPTGASSPQ
jgi:hypothetical protein